jgi:hypothetical protein
MAPDLAYVSRGWWYGPWGIPMWFDGHRLKNILVVAVGASLLAAIVRRWVLPVLPLALPDGGPFHLRDYRYLARVRHRWWVTVGSALVGAITHVVLDAFTHSDGAVSGSSGFFQTPLFEVGSRTIHLYTALQYGGSIVLSVYTVWWLWRAGRERMFRPADLGEADGRGTVLPQSALWTFWGIVAASCVIAGGYASTRTGYHFSHGLAPVFSKSVVIIAFCWVAFFGLTLACLAVEPYVGERSAASGLAARRRDSVAA